MNDIHARPRRTRMLHVALLLGAGLIPPAVQAQDAGTRPIDLPHAIDATLEQHPDLGSAQAAIDEARASLLRAQARPNPELELLTGRIHARQGEVATGAQHMLGLAQPLEWSTAREARQEGARQDIAGAEARARLIRMELVYQVKQAYVDALRSREVLRLTEEDVQHIEAMRDRVKTMVAVGEAPRYEAVKAEAEALAANRQVENARHKLNAARAVLRNLTGMAGDEPRPLKARLPEQLELKSLLAAMEQSNPRYIEARAQVAAARARVSEARADRLPPPTLRAGAEQYPDSRAWTVGLSMPIPLFDQRQGVVAGAEAQLDRALAEGRLRTMTLERELEQAYHRHRGARAQLQAIEGGLLAEAEDALRVAETAYRAGERGILDVLDARRTLRAVRLDHIHALYDTYATLFELERLSDTELLRVNA